jgi:glyoxylase-like metal-dependent hydrolase (beta-lactamase superfamily II)
MPLSQIVPDVFTWTWFSERHGYDFNGHLIRSPGGNLCVDPAEMSDAILDELDAVGVRRILLTNRNHFRAAAKLAERTNARVAAHPADAGFIADNGVTVDDSLTVGQTVGPFTVVDAHGKSPGEVALHWAARKILLVGDACVGNPPGACALLPEKVMDDPAALRASLRRLAELDFDTLLVGDGASIVGGAKAALTALIARFN